MMLGAFHLVRILSSTPRAASQFCELSIWRVTREFIPEINANPNKLLCPQHFSDWMIEAQQKFSLLILMIGI
jgi:hypothetical protein